MSESWTQMRLTPFGLENVLARVRLEIPHGWAWELLEFDGRRWQVLDSGTERSSRGAARRLSGALVDLADSSTF